MSRNKIPGSFTPAPLQELFFPELYSRINIPSYPQESVFLARNNIHKKLRIFFPEKNSARNFFARKKILRKIIPGINLPEEDLFLSNSRKTPSL